MIDAFIFVVDGKYNNQRIDKVISEENEKVTRSFVQKLLEQGNVKVNSIVVAKNYKVKTGDKVIVSSVTPRKLEAVPQNIKLDIMFEDDYLLVVNKPKGMVVHPAAGNFDNTLVNALLYHCKDLSGINGVLRPGIVHRIDKNTSGLLVVAKNDMAHLSLSEQISTHSFDREYRAVVYGHFKENKGMVNAPIGRNPNNRLQMCVTDKNSKNAITHYEVIEEYDKFSYIKLNLDTGRTHQIRVHMKYIGHPVAGDDVYGPAPVIKELEGQCLHACMIGFRHPFTNEHIQVNSCLPEYFERFLTKIKKNNSEVSF